MATIVMKFGGTSVADIARIENAADKVAAEVARGNMPAVVVSAMAGVTNQLVAYCNAITDLPDRAEYDAVVATGEQVTAGLMAIALQKRGLKARSWQGWQAGITSDDQHAKARIAGIDNDALLASVADGVIPVVAGFQGVSVNGRVTTLGRGGSDTSAVALSAALSAARCDIYTDVDGVYTADPRIVKNARKLKVLTFEEMLELASLGAKVLQIRSVELAMNVGIPVQVLSSLETGIGSDMGGTMLVDDKNAMLEHQVISGVAANKDEVKLHLMGVADRPGIAASVVGALAGAGITIDMILQNLSADATTTDMMFTCAGADLPAAKAAIEKLALPMRDFRVDESLAKVSVVGVALKAHPATMHTIFKTLAANDINIQAIATSEIKVSVLIDRTRSDDAVRALHDALGLSA